MINLLSPLSPHGVDWEIHYPMLIGSPSNKKNEMIFNNSIFFFINLANKYPIKYVTHQENVYSTAKNNSEMKYVNILDIGCGYGGLLFNMSPHLDKGDFALGMEIRDKVTNFVGDKIQTLRINSGHKEVRITNLFYSLTILLLSELML